MKREVDGDGGMFVCKQVVCEGVYRQSGKATSQH